VRKKYALCRKIDSFLVITSTTPEATSGASDFSQAAIERRIAAGYQDALTQLKKFSRRSSQDQNGHLNINKQVWRQGIR